MPTSMLLAAALLLGGALPSSASHDKDSLAPLTGSWIGKRTIAAVGTCGWRGDKESTVALDITVSEDGEVVVKHGGAELGKGQVSSSWHITIENNDARARCGEKERRYERDYDGLFTEKGGALYLELEGTDEPCPPGCKFRETYKVKRTDVEEP